MQRCENNAERLGVAQNSRIDNQCFEPLHIGFIEISTQSHNASLSIFRELIVALAFDRVYFCDDPARVRIDHLRAVREVNFVAVVMRRIMTGRDHNSGRRIQVTNGE